MNRNIPKIGLALFLLFIGKGLFSQVLGNNNRLGIIADNIIENKSIVLISQIDNNILYSDINTYNLFLYDKITKESKSISIDEINIRSAKIVKTMNMIVIEIVGRTNMGNGNLYLFDTNLNILLKRYYVDAHSEMWDYMDFLEIEPFKNREYIQGETISKIFRDETLNIDYDVTGENIIRIYGMYDYISEINENRKIIFSENINEEYIFSKENNKFMLLKNSN